MAHGDMERAFAGIMAIGVFLIGIVVGCIFGVIAATIFSILVSVIIGIISAIAAVAFLVWKLN